MAAKTEGAEKPVGYGEATEKLLIFLTPKMKRFLAKEVNRRKRDEPRINMGVVIREALAEKYPASV